MSIMFLITTAYYINLFQSDITKEYNVSLTRMSEEFNTTINEIIKTSALLFYSDDMQDVMFTPKKLSSTRFYVLNEIKQSLSDFRATKSFISNVYVFDTKDDLVISADGSSSMDEFFENSNRNRRYKEKIRELISDPKRDIDYEILSKSRVYNEATDDGAIVIPMVQYNIDNKNCHSLLLIELEKSYVENLLFRYKLTENSFLSIYNNKSKDFYHEYDSSEIITDAELTTLAGKQESGTRFNTGKGNFLFNQIKTDTFTYTAIVSYMDFIKGSLRQVVIPTLISIATIIAVLILSFIYSKRIYNPVKKIMNKLEEVNDEDQQNSNEIEFINEQINTIINRNNSLSNDLSIAFPYVCERYLISILNHNETLSLKNSDINIFLSEHNFAFEHKYFIAVTTNITFTKDFYENYAKEDQMQIQRGILSGLKEAFSFNEKIYVMSFGSNFVCSIINTKENQIDDHVMNKLESFHKTLDVDHRYIKIFSGVGLPHADFNGLFNSYHESLKASSIIPKETDTNISIYETGSQNTEYRYTISQEERLINALSQGDEKNTRGIIEEIIEKNTLLNITETTLKKLYIQIYNTGMRVISRKDLSPYDVLGDDYIDLMVNIDSITYRQVYKTTITFIEKILNLNTYSSDKWDSEIIKNYILDNYTEDIYLDKVADHFSVSPKYMSTIIKKALGMSFQNYVSGLRIEKAKQLLTNTNMTVEVIAQEIGFNSRHPFMRMFKLKEGVSPSVYRNLNKNR